MRAAVGVDGRRVPVRILHAGSTAVSPAAEERGVEGSARYAVGQLCVLPVFGYVSTSRTSLAVSPRRQLQIRLNECVYVKRMTSDEHKRKLSKLNEMTTDGGKAKSDRTHIEKYLTGDAAAAGVSKTVHRRTELRVMRVVRLLMAPE